MKDKITEKYDAEHDPELIRYWSRKGPKLAAFLLVIPGCTIIGYGLGLLHASQLACTMIGLGTGMLVWGLVVALTK